MSRAFEAETRRAEWRRGRAGPEELREQLLASRNGGIDAFVPHDERIGVDTQERIEARRLPGRCDGADATRVNGRRSILGHDALQRLLPVGAAVAHRSDWLGRFLLDRHDSCRP